MAASFDTFRLPHQMGVHSEFIPYTGPPALKPSSRRRTRKAASPITEEWIDIDKILEVKPRPNTESEHEGILTPTMTRARSMGLLYSNGEIGNEDSVRTQDRQDSHQSSRDNLLEPLSAEQTDENQDHPVSKGGSQDNPVVIEDDPADTDSEDDLPSLEEVTRGLTNCERNFDTELDGMETNNQAKGFGCIADSQAHSPDGHNLSEATARVDDGTARKESYDEDPNTGGSTLSAQNKRKRSQSCGDYGFDGRMPDIFSEQPLKDLNSVKRQKPSHASCDDSISNCPPTLKHTCSVPHYRTASETDDANGNRDNEDISNIVSDNDIRSEGVDNDDYDDPDDIHNNKPLEPTMCLAPSSRQVCSNGRNNVPPHKLGALGREDDGGVPEERDKTHSPTAAAQEPNCTGILPPELQRPVSDAGHGDVDSDVDSSSDEDDDNDDDSDFNEDENDEVEDDREDNESPRSARRWGLPAYLRNDSARKRLDKSSLQQLRTSPSPTSFTREYDRRSIVNPGGHHKLLISAAWDRRSTRSVSSKDFLSDSGDAMLATSNAACAEWPVRGFIRRKRVGPKKFYTLDFSLDDLHCQIPSPASSFSSSRATAKSKAPGTATDPTCIVGQARVPKSASRLHQTRSRYTQEEDMRLIDLKERRDLSWGQIKKHFPGRSIGSLQVHYCTKLKNSTTV